jgi:hypothetical protein
VVQEEQLRDETEKLYLAGTALAETLGRWEVAGRE